MSFNITKRSIVSVLSFIPVLFLLLLLLVQMVLELLFTAEENGRRVQESKEEAASNIRESSTSSSSTSNNNNNNKESKEKMNNRNRKKEKLGLKEEVEREEEKEGIVTGLPPSARGRGRGRDRRVTPTRAEKVLLPKESFRNGVGSNFASKLYDGDEEEDIRAKGFAGRREKASFWSPGAALNGDFDGSKCRPNWNANSNCGADRRRYGNVGFLEEGKKGCECYDGNKVGWKSVGSLNGGNGSGNGSVIGRSFSWREEFMDKKFNWIMKNKSFIDGSKVSLVEQVSPRIRIWESGGEAEDVACNIVGNMGETWFHLENRKEASQPRQCPCRSIGEIKKLGKTISKGHKKYQLMLSLQLGIRFSAGKANSKELNPEDFDPKKKFWTRFPPQGSKITPAHQLGEFKWKDYCPMVFRQLRKIFEIDSADYMLAICENGSLRELSSPGKSGSFFYLTQDDRFMIKTVKKSEVKVLLEMLPSYYRHVYRYKNSLITKFFGVHSIKPVGDQKTRFIIMGNLFSSEYRIHRRFDLKGSSYGRMTSKPGGGIDETTTLKDLDLNFIFRLHKYWLQKLNRQIDRDCKFLESERIMDYSLLVGLHFLDNSGNKTSLSPSIVHSGDTNLCQNEGVCRCHLFEVDTRDRDMILSGSGKLIQLGVNMPAGAQYVARSYFDQFSAREGGNLAPSGGEIYKVILHFGIIDILQDYGINKKLEHAYKSLQVDPTSISAVDPKLYSNRFRDFIRKIFVEDK